MSNIDVQILTIDSVICRNIDRFDESERGLLSQNILSHLRNFVEHISLKIYANGNDIENTYENITKALDYIKKRANLKFLNKFHKLLQITASHFTLDEENSERLMLKYYEYLLKIKNFLMVQYGIEVLSNIDDFPLNIETNLKKYYEEIANKIDSHDSTYTKNLYNDRYYIQKIKPFFVDHKVYYEITFTLASDKISKFDRIIAFTNLEILSNYSVKLSIKKDCIKVLDKEMAILFIDDWEVSVRPCEINNFAKIFGANFRIKSGSEEYSRIMSFLTSEGLNLVEFIESSDDFYINVKTQILNNELTPEIFDILDKSRNLIKRNKAGSNVIRYLLYKLNNRIIKKQHNRNSCNFLSDLNLNYGCIPFDKMPFNTSLIYHNPSGFDLIDCISVEGREHEFLARRIKNNTETKGELYTPQNEIDDFENIDKLIQKYNDKLYYNHTNRRLEKYKSYFYIKGYEEDTVNILEKLKSLSLSGIKEYSKSVDDWLKKSSYIIDCDEKRLALRNMFENSKVSLVYGSAGTGKSTIINHLSNFFNEKTKLYLANTNPAIDNLKRKVKTTNCTFRTIASFLTSKYSNTDFDIIIIDECSTVSNIDMLKVFGKANFKLLVLVGDIYQIESITFGNWFNMARNFISESSVFELTKPYRSSNQQLIDLWNRVRNMEDNILELMTKKKYTKILDDSIFEHSEDDEIILCLNYDGLYGINNINSFLQQNNLNDPVQWGVQTYKIDDPIIFNESERFAPLTYNNLKGKIVDIQTFKDKIQFDIEIDKVINELDILRYDDLELIDNPKGENSIIRFSVNKYKSTDEDDDASLETVIPFQVAYAISIHKAQGLEYNSVKIVITNEVDEMISHNIFYTAITRAKENLKIYWTPETEKKVLENLKIRNSNREVLLLAAKFKELKD